MISLNADHGHIVSQKGDNPYRKSQCKDIVNYWFWRTLMESWHGRRDRAVILGCRELDSTA